MRWGRVMSAGVASLAVGACAVVVLGMANASEHGPRRHTVADQHQVIQLPMQFAPTTSVNSTTPTSSAQLAKPTSSAQLAKPTTSAAPALPTPASRPAATGSAASPTRATGSAGGAPAAAVKQAAKVGAAAAPKSASVSEAKAVSRSVSTAAVAPKPAASSRLPLGFSTGNATKVITVTASSYGSTVARLQAWTKVSGGWRRYGSAVTAHIGADGMSRHPSESRSATPVGSFTLTQAFGHDGNPGTSLPYLHTNPSDWWISQPGPLYNTHQRCSSGCGFAQGDPNEHLYYETPYYDYAVVIDYNTRNAPGGVRQGAGSAFFLHVTDGTPTAGCVAIPMSKLVTLMRWLTPSAHPRILIGTT